MQWKKLVGVSCLASAALLLQGCGSSNWNYANGGSSWWPDGSGYYGSDSNPRGGGPSFRQVVVKKRYHMQGGATPTSHKDRDRSWIANQNPRGYTIEVAPGQRASKVAADLHKAPKLHRSAQIKYNVNGKVKSTGVYGTYNSREEAEKAFSKLPAGVRANARVSNWQKVQKRSSKAAPARSSRPNMAKPAPVSNIDDFDDFDEY